MRETLAMVALVYGLIAAYYLARFAVRLKLESLFIGLSQVAMPALIARELKWLKLPSVTVLFGAALTLGGLWFITILWREANRPRPFRDWR